MRVLEAIADDPETRPRDRIRAIDVLARYGIGAASGELTTDDIRARLAATLIVIQRALPLEHAEQLIADIEPIWNP